MRDCTYISFQHYFLLIFLLFFFSYFFWILVCLLLIFSGLCLQFCLLLSTFWRAFASFPPIKILPLPMYFSLAQLALFIPNSPWDVTLSCSPYPLLQKVAGVAKVTRFISITSISYLLEVWLYNIQGWYWNVEYGNYLQRRIYKHHITHSIAIPGILFSVEKIFIFIYVYWSFNLSDY